MQLSNLPAKILAIFAASGVKNTVPLLSSEIANPYNASYDVGFPELTLTPIPSGGKPPDGGDMNGMFNAITALNQWQSAGGVFPYDAALSTAIGGYPKGAFLLQAGGTQFWQSTVDNNTTDPDTGGAGWVNPISITGVPTGSIFQFLATSAPTGYLIAEGQLISRTTYSALWAYAQGSGNIVADGSWTPGNFSTGNGTTTFRLPQLGGYFLRSCDNGNGIDPGRVLGTTQVGQNATHVHTAGTTVSGTASTTVSGTASTTITDSGHSHTEGVNLGSIGKGYLGTGTTEFAGSGSTSFGSGGTPFPTNAAETGISASTSLSLSGATTLNSLSGATTIAASGGSETRPINIAVLACIKT